MTKFFVTGGTGYIGGDALRTFTKAHPEWDITALVRNEEKGAKLKRAFPDIQLVTGELDSADVIEEQARKADVVCREIFSFLVVICLHARLIGAFRLCPCRTRRVGGGNGKRIEGSRSHQTWLFHPYIRHRSPLG